MRSTLSVALLSFAIVNLAACRKDDDDEGGDDESAAIAADAADANEVESNIGSLASSLAAESDEAPRFAFLPAGCLTVTSDEAAKTTTYTFASCTGPYGLITLNGSVALAYTQRGATVDATITAAGFQVNGATIDWDVAASVQAGAAGARTMTWSGTIAGTTAKGRALSRQNDKVFTWTAGGSCIGIDGISTGNLSGRSLEIDVSNYQRCKGECPEAGSTLSVKRLDTGATMSIAYGADSATYTGPRGGTVTFTPACASR